MSLLTLLKAADSLRVPDTGPSRFRMAQQSLPKFAPAKSPVSLRPAPTVRTETPTGETGSLFDPRPTQRAEAIGKTDGLIATGPTVHPAAQIGGIDAGAARKPDSSDHGSDGTERGAGTQKPRGHRIFQDASWLRGRGAGVREREVQTEWALKRVTVSRNDLSDSDLEVVAARRNPAKATHLTLEGPKPAAPAGGFRWLRRARRLFGIQRPKS